MVRQEIAANPNGEGHEPTTEPHHVAARSGPGRRPPGGKSVNEVQGVPSTTPPTPGQLLRAAFRRHAGGVAVITAPGPVGFTATSLTSVAMEPPLLSFGVGRHSSSWRPISTSDHVGIHILAEEQQRLASTFALSGADRFAPPTRWREGPMGVPLLGDTLAWIVCRVVARIPAGDHRLVMAQVVTGSSSCSGRPLVYHEGCFTTLAR